MPAAGGAVSRRWAGLLPGAVISAAFIGPGTVATCAKAGAGFGTALIWAIVFSTFACVVLQEAAARLTVATGQDLGRALRERFGGLAARVVTLLVLGAIVAGCAAYQAGNVLGAVAGARLQFAGSNLVWVAAIGVPAALLLGFAATATVVRLLGAIVGLMGLLFVVTAFGLAPAWGSMLRGALLPTLPPGAAWLALALIGTTVVPYNLFLGSGLARGRPLEEIRAGLIVAIVAGGLISIAIIVVGGALTGEFSFEALAAMLVTRLGPWAGIAFSLGLAVAGFSSALTAPLAAALTARGLFERAGGPDWSDRSWRYRSVWGGVLATGLLFAAAGVRPIPAIIAAQALNGMILPLIAVFLFLVVNDAERMGRLRNRWAGNVTLYLCVAVSVLLGTAGIVRAVVGALGRPLGGTRAIFVLAAVTLAIVSYPMVRALRR